MLVGASQKQPLALPFDCEGELRVVYRVSQSFRLILKIYISGTKRDIDLRLFASYSLDVSIFFF